MELPYFIKLDNDRALLNYDGKLSFYVPAIFFDQGICYMEGEKAIVFGCINYALFESNGKSKNGLKNLFLPTRFTCKPDDIVDMKAVRLTKDSKAMDYKVLEFFNNGEVFSTIKIPQSIVNVEDFFRLFITAKLPGTIPYNRVYEYFNEAFNLNGGKFGVTNQLLGIPIAETYRAQGDIKSPFRLSKSTDMYKYEAVSIKQVPKFVSPFTSITSENWDESLTNAIINKNYQSSPLEKLFML